MAIQLGTLLIAKDLLLFNAADATLDTLITEEWEQQVAVLAREFDLFVTAATLSTTAGKAIYAVPVGTTRILSVLHRGITLGYTDRATLDLHDPYWETAQPATPQFWSYNAVPGEMDTPAVTVTPREFVLHPAPDGAQAGASTLLLIIETTPDNYPRWVEPILLYRTVAHVAAENPNLVQPEKGVWFNQLADFWLETARRQMQV
jgi:hypothetical protein